jgi:hypothetical protein
LYFVVHAPFRDARSLDLTCSQHCDSQLSASLGFPLRDPKIVAVGASVISANGCGEENRRETPHKKTNGPLPPRAFPMPVSSAGAVGSRRCNIVGGRKRRSLPTRTGREQPAALDAAAVDGAALDVLGLNAALGPAVYSAGPRTRCRRGDVPSPQLPAGPMRDGQPRRRADCPSIWMPRALSTWGWHSSTGVETHIAHNVHV